MNGVEKVGISLDSSQPRTPAFTNFCSNFEELDHLIRLTMRGIKGTRQELAVLVDPVIQSGKTPPEILEFLHAVKDIVRTVAGAEVVFEWLPVMMVTTVEAYLIDVLAYAAGIDSTLMGRSEQSISYAELANASSIEEVMTELRYRWARNFLDRGGPRSWAERLTKMGARAYHPETAQEMETLWGIRHLVVHAAGVATADFTRRHPHLGLKVGERVQLNDPQVGKWIEHILDFVVVTEAFFVERCRL